MTKGTKGTKEYLVVGLSVLAFLLVLIMLYELPSFVSSLSTSLSAAPIISTESISTEAAASAPLTKSPLTLTPEFYDFGVISQEDGIQRTTFLVTNSDNASITIDYLETSCMCTEASLSYNGIKGPSVGLSMHPDNSSNYELTIPPGKSAKLEVTYDPMAHGIQKEPVQQIIRYVKIHTTNTQTPEKIVKIMLTQKRQDAK